VSLTNSEIQALLDQAQQLRHDIVSTTVWAGGAHIGGAMSVVDILTLLYFHTMKINPSLPGWEDRDRLILSKGHAGVGFAPVLARKGYFPLEQLETFNHFKSPFGMHLDGSKVPGCDVSTGSLGHGLPMGVGLALGARYQKKDWRVFCILGDGECNEGSNWEAAMAAAHYKLNNLITILDRNSLMIDGPTEEVMGLEPLADKWKAFGFNVIETDGHDFQSLHNALEGAFAHTGGPSLILANTIKGKGISFMENDVRWHYGSIDSAMAVKARESIDQYYSGLAMKQGDTHE
jgi:transketolase